MSNALMYDADAKTFWQKGGEKDEDKSFWQEGDAYDPARIFLAYYKMASRIADRLGRKYGYYDLFMDEAISYLANLILEKWNEFRPARAGRTTWIYRSIYWHLQTTFRSIRHRHEVPLSSEEIEVCGRVVSSSWKRSEVLQKQVHDLSDDANVVFVMLQHDPDGLCKRFGLPDHHRKFLEHLSQQPGWFWNRALSAWEELRGVIV